MAKHDPYKPPMSLEQSERMLKGYEETKATKEGWRTFGMFLLLLLALCGAGLVAWLSVAVPVIGWIVGFVALVYALGAIANAEKR